MSIYYYFPKTDDEFLDQEIVTRSFECQDTREPLSIWMFKATKKYRSKNSLNNKVRYPRACLSSLRVSQHAGQYPKGPNNPHVGDLAIENK